MTKSPQVVPDKASQVPRVRIGGARGEHVQHGLEVPALPKLMSQPHLRSVSMFVCKPFLLVRAVALHLGCYPQLVGNCEGLMQLGGVPDFCREEKQDSGNANADGTRDSRPAPRPLYGPLPSADRPRLDRLSSQEPAQVVRQGLGTCVTFARLFLQTLQTDRVQIARHSRLQTHHRNRFLRLHLP